MNIQQFAEWKNSHPLYRASVLKNKKIHHAHLTKLIASMEAELEKEAIE